MFRGRLAQTRSEPNLQIDGNVFLVPRCISHGTQADLEALGVQFLSSDDAQSEMRPARLPAGWSFECCSQNMRVRHAGSDQWQPLALYSLFDEQKRERARAEVYYQGDRIVQSVLRMTSRYAEGVRYLYDGDRQHVGCSGIVIDQDANGGVIHETPPSYFGETGEGYEATCARLALETTAWLQLHLHEWKAPGTYRD
jgi:hypothetical protein